MLEQASTACQVGHDFPPGYLYTGGLSAKMAGRKQFPPTVPTQTPSPTSLRRIAGYSGRRSDDLTSTVGPEEKTLTSWW